MAVDIPEPDVMSAPLAVAAQEMRNLSGIQTIVELLVLRRQLDAAAGRSTGTIVSGYPGSPLGTLDLTLDAQPERLKAHDIIHRPGLNEELAMSLVWGGQMGAVLPYQGVDGVASVWYGKGPGLDRSGDALRHANTMGAGPGGGMVVLCGDDPSAKSSTLNCDSQFTFQDMAMPVLYPGNQQELLDLGIHAFRMSRQAGPVVGIKIVTAVADGTGTVDLDPARFGTAGLGGLTVGGEPWVHVPQKDVGPHRVPDQELRVERRLEAVKDYAAKHGLNTVTGASAARLGIVIAGKTYHDFVEALADFGIVAEDLATSGIAVLRLAMTYPLIDSEIIDFAGRAETLLVIEEKRPFIEGQARAILHEHCIATRLLGKRDAERRPLVPSTGELDGGAIAEVLLRLLPDLAERRRAKAIALASTPPQLSPARTPGYCSGCPHNRSTVAPEGALVGGGIGCHGIFYFEPRQSSVSKLPPPPMGAEGVPWIGLAPFVAQPHLIQNLGDGTYSHSGALAIRASVAAGVNVTYKILYNAAVAMTGGQPVTGLLDVPALSRALEAEGVAKVVVCAAQPELYGPEARWGLGVEVRGRDELGEVQESLRQTSGVTVIIYDQRCATEARRLRKRGELETPPSLVFINSAVCEGCGDCVTNSNCASVQPLPTEFGEKKQIEQSSCNRDYTCLKGDCPSFVTFTPKQDGAGKRVNKAELPDLPSGVLPEPDLPPMTDPFGICISGIGGMGVITANRLIAAAAKDAGLFSAGTDQTGLAQKSGAVVSHLKLAQDRNRLGAATIGEEGADLYLSGDIFQAASAPHLARMRPGRTVAVIESHATPTMGMLQTGQGAADAASLRRAVVDRVGSGRAAFVPARRIADTLLRQGVLANLVLLGAAWQLGGIPLSRDVIEAALAKDARQAKGNLAAFAWGRWAAYDPDLMEQMLDGKDAEGGAAIDLFAPSEPALAEARGLVEVNLFDEAIRAHIVRRAAQAIDYQDVGVARRLLRLAALAADNDGAGRGWKLTLAIIDGFHKLLTYKDEYEVARLHGLIDYDKVARSLGIEGDFDMRHHLHPEQLRTVGFKDKVRLGKLGSVMFAALRPMKRLRGTWADAFGWHSDRRMERAVAGEYESLLEAAITAGDYDRALRLAETASLVRGFGPVKRRNVERWREVVAAF